MADNYNVSEIVGKTLYAKVKVNLYGYPDSTRKPIGTVNAGNPIGVVDSWLNPDQADGKLWWSFINSKGLRYHVPHALNVFDVGSLKGQGALTTEEKIAKQEYENAGITDKLMITAKTYLPWVLGAFIAIPLLKEVIKKKF